MNKELSPYPTSAFLIMFICVIGLYSSSNAQVTPIEFRLNMNYQIDQEQFFPDNEFVDLAGTFNDWGGGTPAIFSDEDEDGIYELTLNLAIGSSVQFKSRINGEWEGREEFAGGGPNRSYVVQQGGVYEYWYNDEAPSTELFVQIDASSSFVLVGETVQFTDRSNGSPVSWSWTFENGSPSTSSEQNPLVVFNAEGNATVSLTIEDSDGNTDTQVFEDYISVGNDDIYWWNEAVFYQIFVRSFYDSDGDGNGDFKGMIERLDYLNDGNPATHDDLGVTGIWLMPMMQSPSYHGYDVVDYRTVEQDYGTNEDFKAFVNAAHDRGIRVIIDYVMNHTGYDHPWFEDSRNSLNDKRDWYVWEDTNLGWRGSWGQEVWHRHNGDYYFGVFWGGMPDLNYYNPAVKEEMFDVAKFWLEESDIDGFRLDAVRILYENGESQQEDTDETFDLWRDFRDYYKSIKPDAFTVGEAWTSTNIVQRYVDGTGMDYCFEFDLSYAIIDAAQNGNVGRLKEQMDKVMQSYPYMQFGSFLTNHDMNRVMSVLEGNEAQAHLAADLLLTLPGIPYIYYGEEIGMLGVKPDEDIRTPLQWNASSNAGFTEGRPWRNPNSDYETKNIESQQADPSSLWSTYKNLISLRQNHAALSKGNYKLLDVDINEVYTFLRSFEEEHILVVANASNDVVDLVNISSSLLNLPSGQFVLLDLLTGNTYPLTVNASGDIEGLVIEDMPAKSTSVLKIVNEEELDADLFFNVDMSRPIQEGWFLPEEQTVDLVSTVGNLQLSDNNGDSIYDVSVENEPIGSDVQYRYRINNTDDGSEEFAGTSFMRSYKVKEGDNDLLDKYEGQGEVTITSLAPVEEEINIYPNPAKDVIVVSALSQFQTSISYSILDMNGRVQLQDELTPTSNYELPVHILASGSYILLLHTRQGDIRKHILIRR